ncbi:MAG: indole-3-glycerol phosphate synthase TrpC [Pirellulaceae bacterium]
MQTILDKIVATKHLEIVALKQSTTLDELKRRAADAPAVRDFAAAIRNHSGVSLIAEVKKASPSKGLIRADFDPREIARTYEACGAQCISVLTDEQYFQGKLEYLSAIRDVVSIPLLRKDFILDEFQVVEARAAGADAVLLIAECLSAEKLRELHDQIVEWGMTPLVELYDANNLPAVLACNPKLVGVNNRDLNTFVVRLEHSVEMKQQMPDDILFVSESGIATHADVQFLARSGVDAMLVGESLTREPDIASAVRQLIGQAS